MRVVCDQCAASYKVPNERLTKPINKATCKQCGSRLLIPKPKPGADPDERVVVPAVAASGGMGNQTLMPSEEEEDDKTMPIVDTSGVTDDVPLLIGSPIGQDERAKMRNAKRAGASPAPLSPAAPKAPIPAAAPAPAPAASDASTAMTIGLLGAVAAFTGSLMLGMMDDPTLRLAGLFLAVVGSSSGMLALGIQRFTGRNEAMGSLFGGLFFGAVASGLLLLAQQGEQNQTAAVVEPTPATAKEEVKETVEANEAGLAADAEAAEEAAPSKPKPKVAKKAPAKAPAQRSSAKASTPAREPAAAPAPKAKPAPAPAPEPSYEPEPREESRSVQPKPAAPVESRTTTTSSRSSKAMIDPVALETILQSNPKVQGCFHKSLRSKEISMPISVPVSFYLSESGSGSGLRMKQVRAPELERCLDGALDGMRFPNEGAGSVTYTFALR